MRLVLLCLLINVSLSCASQEEEIGFWQLCQNGASYQKRAEYSKAESAYKSALLCAYDKEDIEKVHINLASIYTITGRFVEAEMELLACPDSNLQAKIHLSNVYLRMGEYDKSLSCLNEVIAHTPKDSLLNSIAHQNAGYVYWQIRNYEKAKEELEIALPYLTGMVKLASLGNYALILAKLEQYDKALKTIDEAISLIDTNSEDYTILLRKKAEISLLSGKRKESYLSYKKYYEKEKVYATSNFSTMTEQNRLDFWKTLKPNISKVFALEDDCPEFLLDVALFRREVALLGNADNGEMTKRLNRTGQQLRKALKPHDVAIDFVRYEKNDTVRYGAIVIPSLSMAGGVRFIPLWTEDRLRSFSVGGMSLEDALCSNNMSDKDCLYSDSLLARFVWDKLDRELTKYDYEDVYFAPEGLLHLLAIEYMREDNGVCLHRMTTLAHLLDRGKHSVSRGSRMLAAGGFDYNSTSLQVNKSTTQQFNNSAIQQLNNSANHDAMEFLQSKIGGAEHPFSYLKGARLEIDSIRACSSFLTDTTSVQTEEELKRAIGQRKYDVLHLSTHGYALDVEVPRVPEALCDSITEDRSLLASGIALTGANVAYRNGVAEDGILSAREFCEMDMRDVDLMVLSACQTGLGRFCDEGPAGLVRGLKKAGAGALIVSLWSVDDEATMLLMKHLYMAINEQKTPDIHEAFNAARMNFSKDTKVVQRFDRRKMKKTEYEESYNLPRFCNSFILIDAVE